MGFQKGDIVEVVQSFCRYLVGKRGTVEKALKNAIDYQVLFANGILAAKDADVGSNRRVFGDSCLKLIQRKGQHVMSLQKGDTVEILSSGHACLKGKIGIICDETLSGTFVVEFPAGVLTVEQANAGKNKRRWSPSGLRKIKPAENLPTDTETTYGSEYERLAAMLYDTERLPFGERPSIESVEALRKEVRALKKK